MVTKKETAKALRVALFHPYGSILKNEDGGGATYEKALSNLLEQSSESLGIEIVHFVPKNTALVPRRPARTAKHSGSPIVFYRATIAERLFSLWPGSFLSSIIGGLGWLRTEKLLSDCQIDLAYFSAPCHTPLRLKDTPYIFTVWDIGHRELTDFPETGSYKEWHSREKMLSFGVGRAFHVMVDSATTGTNLELTYSLGPKWSALGLLPNVPGELLRTPALDGDFVIYPAARWPHKNHRTALLAFREIVDNHPDLRLVLTGKDEGAGPRILELIRELDLEDSVIDLGLVSRIETLSLIRAARALVMPTLLGPTNLPPLEALALGTPAIVSDVHDYGDDVDDLVTRVPATDVDAWVLALRTVLETPKPSPVKFTTDDALRTHKKVFDAFSDRRKIIEMRR